MKTQKMKINVKVIISLVLLAFVIGVEIFVIWPNNQSLENFYKKKLTENDINNHISLLSKQYENKSLEHLTKKWKSMQTTVAIAAVIFMIYAVV
tara:strand:+ start:852 stop:1133 length:282 start_codon:yes stop_codon:yes gene_type:complete